MVQADRTLHERLERAVNDDLVETLQSDTLGYNGVSEGLSAPYMIGDIEDANVLIQNSLWQNVPLGQLGSFQQLTNLQDHTGWAPNQVEQIALLQQKFDQLAERIETVCV